ncbi:MAG: hypothetical protein J7M14_05205 [Planctomycetes bacterium]|nr:hypothetical protein [Planctomycetota bacterium]
MTGRVKLLSGVVLALAIAAAGCGEPAGVVKISYARPATYVIPNSIKRLAVLQFVGKSEQDRKGGDIAAEKLSAHLSEVCHRYGRYELYERKRMKGIVDEQEMALVMDSGVARKIGRLVNVDAVVYGTILVTTRDEKVRQWGVLGALRRSCSVVISVSMDDVRTGRTITSVSVTREYDSAAAGGPSGSRVDAIRKRLRGPGVPQPAAAAVNRLIDECIKEFVAKISPHDVQFIVELESSPDEIVTVGNKLAQAGEHDEALEKYLQAIKRNVLDPGATFNAGVMLEAKGDLRGAEKKYGLAFQLESKEKYVLARSRVRAEMRKK